MRYSGRCICKASLEIWATTCKSVQHCCDCSPCSSALQRLARSAPAHLRRLDSCRDSSQHRSLWFPFSRSRHLGHAEKQSRLPQSNCWSHVCSLIRLLCMPQVLHNSPAESPARCTSTWPCTVLCSSWWPLQLPWSSPTMPPCTLRSVEMISSALLFSACAAAACQCQNACGHMV